MKGRRRDRLVVGVGQGGEKVFVVVVVMIEEMATCWYLGRKELTESRK